MAGDDKLAAFLTAAGIELEPWQVDALRAVQRAGTDGVRSSVGVPRRHGLGAAVAEHAAARLAAPEDPPAGLAGVPLHRTLLGADVTVVDADDRVYILTRAAFEAYLGGRPIPPDSAFVILDRPAAGAEARP